MSLAGSVLNSFDLSLVEGTYGKHVDFVSDDESDTETLVNLGTWTSYESLTQTSFAATIEKKIMTVNLVPRQDTDENGNTVEYWEDEYTEETESIKINRDEYSLMVKQMISGQKYIEKTMSEVSEGMSISFTDIKIEELVIEGKTSILTILSADASGHGKKIKVKVVLNFDPSQSALRNPITTEVYNEETGRLENETVLESSFGPSTSVEEAEVDSGL